MISTLIFCISGTAILSRVAEVTSVHEMGTIVCWPGGGVGETVISSTTFMKLNVFLALSVIALSQRIVNECLAMSVPLQVRILRCQVTNGNATGPMAKSTRSHGVGFCFPKKDMLLPRDSIEQQVQHCSGWFIRHTRIIG